ncbi:DUF935 domain-containing protein [Yersinia alsatica]|uniref:DUF935 domain-containing protein n=1 Tax=Yersinia alsatica TaxID=2890317 RepID=UPI00119EC5D2|nr:DUF935 domain-containing protein [Yersinia alsatica]
MLVKMLSRLVDAFGRRFWFKGEPQTGSDDSRWGKLQRHYSDHPVSGLTPARAAEILVDAERGLLLDQCDLAEDMEEKDSHLQSELGKRRRAVQSLKWTIKPPPNASREEIRDAELLTEILLDASYLPDCIFDATDAILKGFSCQEIEWEHVEGLLIPREIEWRDPAWFQTHPDDRNNLRLRDGSYHGAELQPFGWIQHYAKSKSGYLARTGLIRTLVWPFIFKNYSVRDLAEFLEIYGLPIRVGQYPAGATDKEKQTLLQAVMSIGHNAGGIIPRSMMIDFKAAADGTADPFLSMMSWAELSMSKAILGGTLTSQADGASSTNALGNVHNEVRFEVRSSDATQLSATLTRDLLFPLYVFNCQSYNNQRRHPRFEFDLSEPEDVTAYATALPGLVGMGMKIPVQWAHDKLQIPIAAKDEDCLTAIVPAPDFSQALLSAHTPRPGVAALTATPQPTDVMSDAVSGEQWQAAIDPLLTPIIEALNSGGYAAAKTKADELYVGMDDAQIADILHRAMFVAETWGRLNATAG